MSVAFLISSGVAGASRSLTEIVAVGSTVPLLIGAWSFSAGLGARVTVADTADTCGTKGLAVTRNLDFLMSMASGDDLYRKKRPGSLLKDRVVRPSTG